MTAAGGKRLGTLLVNAGLLSPDQLDEALQGAGDRSITEVLVDENVATEEQISQAIAEQLGLTFVDLGKYEIDANAATMLSTDIARRYQVLPIAFQDDELVVAMSDPANIFAVDDLRIVTGYEIRPVVASESDLVSAIDRFSAMQADVDTMVGDLEDAVGVEEEVEEEEEGADLDDESAPVAKLMNLIITEAIRENAGDIFVEPQDNDVRIRFRVDGVCHEVVRSPKKLHRALISRIKIASSMNIAEKRVPQDGRFGVVVDGKAVDFRVAVVPTVRGEVSVMRLLHRESARMTLEDLGLERAALVPIEDALSKPYGAILVVGPTGCGKTTTLYASINRTIDPARNLITVEDPVEYRIEGLGQVQVNEKAGLTFAAALRSILRQDPDIVMIGEIRDKQTGTIAIEAALTGHLVFSTLHTNDAPSAITRLTEMGIEPFLTASAVNLVACQRLARLLCKECKEAYTPTEEALDKIGFPYEPGKPPTLYKAKGCKRCNNIGYRGRTGIFEVMTLTEDIERLAVEHCTTDELAAQALEDGMIPLRQAGFDKVLSGQTSIEEILRVVV